MTNINPHNSLGAIPYNNSPETFPNDKIQNQLKKAQLSDMLLTKKLDQNKLKLYLENERKKSLDKNLFAGNYDDINSKANAKTKIESAPAGGNSLAAIIKFNTPQFREQAKTILGLSNKSADGKAATQAEVQSKLKEWDSIPGIVVSDGISKREMLGIYDIEIGKLKNKEKKSIQEYKNLYALEREKAALNNSI